MRASSEPYTEEQINAVLIALVGHNGNLRATRRYLAQTGQRAPSELVMKRWITISHIERYETLREEWSRNVERNIANDMRDAAAAAVKAEQLAVEHAVKRLEAGTDEDPARSALNLARAAQSSTDKMLALTGRPQYISETRNVTEILRSLVAQGVLLPPPETKELSEAEP